MIIFQLIRRVLIWILLMYWAIFIGYTAVKFFSGGPSAVVVWYRHIARAPFQWDWRVFLAQQAAILTITLALCFFGRNRTFHPQSGAVEEGGPVMK